MQHPADLAAVLRRLESALDRLEAAVSRRALQDATRANLDEELAILQDDRSRLAVELDGSLAHGKTLAAANAEVERRLGRSMEALRQWLEPGHHG